MPADRCARRGPRPAAAGTRHTPAAQYPDLTGKRPESVLVVVAAGDGGVLLLVRRHPPGFWQSVTGSLRDGERAREAAVRELAEETGLVVAPEALIDTGVTHRYPIAPAWRARYAPHVTHNVERVFVAALPAPVPITVDPAEHTRFAWVSRAEALERAGSATDRAAIRALGPDPAGGVA